MTDEGYFAKPPKQQLYYRGMAFTLSIAGLYWYEWWGYKFSKFVKYFLLVMYFVITVCVPGCLVLQVLYVYVYSSEIKFSTHGNIFAVLPSTVLVLTKVLSAHLKTYRDMMKNFLDKIHLYNFRSNAYLKRIAIKAEKQTRFLTIFFFVFLVLDWALWTITPILYNSRNSEAIRNKTLPMQTCFYLWLPFDYEYDFKYWFVAQTTTSFLIATGCTVVTTFDTINYSIVFHLIGHIKGFIHLINNSFSGDMTEKETKQKLIEIIKYHCFLLKIFRDIETAFGFNVTGNYLYNLVVDSIYLYHIMLGDNGSKFMYGFMLLAFLGGLFVMSFVLEEVRSQTDNIPQCVYDIPWEKMSISNQKTVLLILARTQLTLEYKGAGGLIAGVKPTIQILKSTFSYYVMLKSSL